jgi:nucleoside-diphosphate-sugar epimerase
MVNALTERVLITGGSGFIGSALANVALRRGFDLCNLDVRPPREETHGRFWRKIDVRDAVSLEKAAVDFRPRRVIHLASDIDVNIKTLSACTSTINGTENVLNAVRRLPSLRKAIFVSTQFVVRPGVEVDNERFLEPYTIYGHAKAEAENRIWGAELAVPWLILRPTIIWGPHHPSFAREIFRHIARRRYLHPVDRRPITRAFGYVTNTAEQMMEFAMIDPSLTNAHVYYLGDGSIDYDQWADAFSIGLTGRPARRIPAVMLRLLGKAGDLAKKLGVPSPIDSGRAFRMSTSSKIDLRATHDLVGSPRVSFEAGVAETLAWLSAMNDYRQIRFKQPAA